MKKSKKKGVKKNTKVSKITIESTPIKNIKLPPFKVEKVVTSFSQTEGWNIKKLNVPDTWKFTKGEGVTVLIIDTGATDHPDLNGAIDVSKCRSFLSDEPDVFDLNGHSTHCQGIVGARDNDQGMVGVAPLCTIITAKALGADGSGSNQSVVDALNYAVELKPDIVSMSLGSPEGTEEMHTAIKKLFDMNIPVIAAAGNSGTANDVNYPGKYPECVTVTAFDENGSPAPFNSTGPEVEISAPGVNIFSTWLNKSYAKLSGTSMATPFVAGTVALLIAKHRKQEKETGLNDCKTVDQIKEHLSKYSDDKGILGHDDVWGYGMLNPVKLITDDTLVPTVSTSPGISSVPVQDPVNIKKKSWWRRWLDRLF